MKKRQKKKKNYAGFKFDLSIIGIVIGFIIFLFGIRTFYEFSKFMSSPIASTGIPIWLILVGIVLFMYMRRKQGYRNVRMG